MIRAHLFISGRVQTVFFRATTQREAEKLNVMGFVKNLPDGRVEIVIEGERDDVQRLIKWCKKGSLLAKVKNVEIIQEKYTDEFNKFNVLY